MYSGKPFNSGCFEIRRDDAAKRTRALTAKLTYICLNVTWSCATYQQRFPNNRTATQRLLDLNLPPILYNITSKLYIVYDATVHFELPAIIQKRVQEHFDKFRKKKTEIAIESANVERE